MANPGGLVFTVHIAKRMDEQVRKFLFLGGAAARS